MITLLDKAKLRQWFAEGKTDLWIAAEVGRVPTTIAYHRKNWEKANVAPEVPVLPPSDPAAGQQEPIWRDLPKQKRALEVGQWYEGAVVAVRDNFALIDLVELAEDTGYSPRGILHQNRTAGGENPAAKYKPNDSVTVKIVDKKLNETRGKLDIWLSTKAGEEERQRERPRAAGFLPYKADALQSAPQPAGQPVVYRPSLNLCDSCAKQDVCPVLTLLVKALETADLGDRYNLLKIKTRPLEVERCEAYRVDEVR